MDKLIETLADTIAENGSYMFEPQYQELAEKHAIRFLGHGVARAAFLIDGLVYKFMRNSYTSQSEDERRNYVRWSAMMEEVPEKFEGWGLPLMDFITVNGYLVVVAQFIPTDEPAVDVFHTGNPFGSIDCHPQNCFIYEGIRYMVDLGA